MIVKTGLKAGEDFGTTSSDSTTGNVLLSSPFINKWHTCYRCKGLKDQYGNISNATCSMCWPVGAQAPV
jgi:hypothetical protein